MAIDQYGRFIRSAPAPRIQTNYNSISSSSSTGFYQRSRFSYIWDRFNDRVASFGNWIDDIIEPVSAWITIITYLIAAICLICWIFNDTNIFYIILRFFGACIIGGIGVYVIAIGCFLMGLFLKCIRFLFWNGWTLLIALILGIGFWAYSAFSTPSYNHTPVTETEVYAPAHNTYRCTAAVLNVRLYPTKSSYVIGTLRQGQEVEVLDIQNGFAAIEYNGQRGYASIKYLTKINE